MNKVHFKTHGSKVTYCLSTVPDEVALRDTKTDPRAITCVECLKTLLVEVVYQSGQARDPQQTDLVTFELRHGRFGGREMVCLIMDGIQIFGPLDEYMHNIKTAIWRVPKFQIAAALRLNDPSST